ncbi:hypothetical protein [Tepidibacter aestuarii]|uniref:hypothetical protein n=1 Tax=Tepidibacter aestuarii TaxID=2925782 RepID=UPI0020BF14C9|nr:hypothetical protein [Tepidibacter aestuarii]CAH2214874.1 membrane protein of unknown function [Tepidibacter aestuarii]
MINSFVFALIGVISIAYAFSVKKSERRQKKLLEVLKKNDKGEIIFGSKKFKSEEGYFTYQFYSYLNSGIFALIYGFAVNAFNLYSKGVWVFASFLILIYINQLIYKKHKYM